MHTPLGRASTARRGRQGTIVVLVALMVATSLAGAVVPAPRAALAATATTTTDLNLRAGPGTGYGVITVMPASFAPLQASCIFLSRAVAALS